MHGRLKVKSTAEQLERKKKEREEKLAKYNAAVNVIFAKRGVQAYDEPSLKASAKVLESNPDFATLWNIRRDIFLRIREQELDESFQAVLEDELRFLEGCLRVNPKSYGTWHQRAWVMDHLPEPHWEKELALCNKFLEYDERNFHCWDYRRFLVNRCKKSPKKEIEFTTEKIKSNFSNYSSWHYRSKLLPLVHPDPNSHIGVQEPILLQEFEMTQNAFFTDPGDQSAWFYHRWLLGRGTNDTSVLSVTVRPPSSVTVAMTKKVQSHHLAVGIDGHQVPVRWLNPRKFGWSHVWLGELDLMQGGVVEVQYNEGPAVSLTCQGQQVTQYNQDRALGFRDELSSAASSVLKAELEACQQLHELEPDNKWALLTIVSLMRALDATQYEQQIHESIIKLAELDPSRGRYYHDFLSTCIMENHITAEGHELGRVNLSNKGLSRTVHMEHLAATKQLDLSFNKLKFVNDAEYLQCLEVFILDNNNLENCDALMPLVKLHTLSLKNNEIKSVDNVTSLRCCGALDTVVLTGNPLAKDKDIQSRLKAVLPNVKNLHL